MASQYDDMVQKADEIRKTMASNQNYSLQIRQNSSGLLDAVAMAKAKLAAANRNAAKILHEADLLTSNQKADQATKVTPPLIKMKKSAIRKILI